MINKLDNYITDTRVQSVYEYDDLTLQDLICKFFEKINYCVDISNESNEFLKWLKEIGMPIEVQKIMNEFLADGTLAEILNTALLEINNRLNNSILEQDNKLNNAITQQDEKIEVIKQSLIENFNRELELINSSLTEFKQQQLEENTNIKSDILNVKSEIVNIKNTSTKQNELGINILLFDGVDDTEKFQNALNSNYKILYVPNVTITRPLTIPYNSGKKIIGLGGLKSSVINCNIGIEYQYNALFQYDVPKGQKVHNDNGLTMKDLWIRGNNSFCHGVFMQYVCYPLIENVIIEGFKGYGLCLDKCQDGSFNNLVIQDCGRTSGSYENMDDVSNNSKTLHAPLELISSWEGDKCNMLRFNDCQIEENKLSPYVRISGGGIGLFFNNIHAEVRTHGFGKMDFMEITNGGDFEFVGMAVSDTFRNGFICKGQGQFKFNNSRLLNNVIIGEQDNTNYALYRISNCGIKNVTIGSCIGDSSITNCSFTNLTLNKPSHVHTYYGLKLDTFIVNDQGSYPWITMENSIIETLNANRTTKNVILRNTTINQSCTMNTGEGGRLESCQINGTNNLSEDDISFFPKIRWGRKIAPPSQGIWGKGDIVINSNPTTGQPIGWVCTEGGSSGVWKGFGIIQ